MHDLVRVKEAFDEAERVVKRYERLTLLILPAAVNQLRYAGRHLLEAELSAEAEQRAVHLDKAYRHAVRAGLDARECAISELLGVFNRFHNSGYPQDAIDALLPEYATWRAELLVAQQRLEQVPQLRLLSKEEIQTLDDTIDWLSDKRIKLLDVTTRLNAAREADQREKLAALRNEEQLKEDALAFEDNRRYFLNMIVSIASLIVGLLGVGLTIYGVVITLR